MGAKELDEGTRVARAGGDADPLEGADLAALSGGGKRAAGARPT